MPYASLSLDLDNKWSYMKTHGDPGWESFPSYLDLVVPRVLEFLEERDLKITFFIVGQDAALEKNHAALKSISDAGHEVGNHSFQHLPWLHLFEPTELEDELARAEDHIRGVTGEHPVGFRGPGYSLSETTLKTLIRRGYLYDCSTFPTFLGPVARAYYFFTAKLTREQKQERKKLFGNMWEGFRPLKPYTWKLDNGSILEIPVTTMPLFKTPIHLSYVIYLSCYSTWLAKQYFRMFLLMCRITGVEPSVLLHPLDFLGAEDDEDLAFFPAMNLGAEHKCEIVSWVCEQLGQRHQVVTMQQHYDAIVERTAELRPQPTAEAPL